MINWFYCIWQMIYVDLTIFMVMCYYLYWCVNVVEFTCGDMIYCKIVCINKSGFLVLLYTCIIIKLLFKIFLMCENDWICLGMKIIINMRANRFNIIELRCKLIIMIDNWPQNLLLSSKLCPDTRQRLRSFNHTDNTLFWFD